MPLKTIVRSGDYDRILEFTDSDGNVYQCLHTCVKMIDIPTDAKKSEPIAMALDIGGRLVVMLTPQEAQRVRYELGWTDIKPEE